MYPILWQSGTFILSSWHVFYLLAAFVAWWSLQFWSARIWPESQKRQVDTLFLLLYVSGYFGARGLSLYLEDESSCLCLSTLQNLFQIGSMTLYGGILSAGLVAMIYAKRLHMPLRQLADLLVLPTLLSIAIGRIGCLLNGDDYGRPVVDQVQAAWWAMQMPNLQDGLYRYPVQVLETVFCLFFAWLCWLLRKSSLGRVGSLGIFSYAGLRFSLEFFRGDERGVFLFDMFSPAQVISFGLAASWLLFILSSKRPELMN